MCPSLNAQLSTRDAPELPLQPVKQVRFLPPSPSISPAPPSPPLCTSVPMSPTPSRDPLDVISPPAPTCRSGRAAQPRRDWRESVAPMTPSASSPSPAPKEEPVSPPLVPVADDDDRDELDVIGDDGHLAGSVSSKPHSFREAMTPENAQQWVDALAEEMAVYELNGTWELVEGPPGVKPIVSRWVLKIKHYADGSVERYKACLVAKGFSQRSGIDYFETFAPTAKLASIRVVLALTAALNLHLHSIDVSNMFLNGDIDADVYMEQPEGFVIGGSHIVCKLRKGLYGTRQGARAWQIKLQWILVEELQFRTIYSDGSFFVYRNGDDFVMLPFHVDDGTFGASSNELVTDLIGRLRSTSSCAILVQQHFCCFAGSRCWPR